MNTLLSYFDEHTFNHVFSNWTLLIMEKYERIRRLTELYFGVNLSSFLDIFRSQHNFLTYSLRCFFVNVTKILCIKSKLKLRYAYYVDVKLLPVLNCEFLYVYVECFKYVLMHLSCIFFIRTLV